MRWEYFIMGAMHATKTALKVGIETIAPFPSVRAVVHELDTLSAALSFTHKPATCPLTCSKNDSNKSLELVPS